MRRIAIAAAVYFGVIFSLGFVLGAARTAVLAAAPDVTRLQAVLVEAPIMLTASWFTCAFIMRQLSVPKTITARVGMGGGAFLLLVLAELLLAVWLLGQSPAQHFQSYGEPSHALGLLAQIAFGLFPLMQAPGR